jgi:hypothetical protein
MPETKRGSAPATKPTHTTTADLAVEINNILAEASHEPEVLAERAAISEARLTKLAWLHALGLEGPDHTHDYEFACAIASVDRAVRPMSIGDQRAFEDALERFRARGCAA